jgi:hypothetical protein
LVLRSHFSNLFELLAKQKPAKSKRGVVGTIGKTIPMTPTIKLTKPNTR